MRCPSGGFESPDAQKFCSECARKLGSLAPIVVMREVVEMAPRSGCAEEAVKYLALAGRGRKSTPAAERARAAVTKAIREAITRIERHHAPLGRHLRKTIRTG